MADYDCINGGFCISYEDGRCPSNSCIKMKMFERGEIPRVPVLKEYSEGETFSDEVRI